MNRDDERWRPLVSCPRGRGTEIEILYRSQEGREIVYLPHTDAYLPWDHDIGWRWRNQPEER